jgi:hypothetical protein
MKNMSDKLQDLETRISNIEARNKAVEFDKRWETSWTRKISLALLTYISILLYFAVIGVASPFLNAIVPTAGFMLSTLTLPFLKNIWLNIKK